MSRDALIVGINSYQYLPALKAPANDAEAIAQCLEQHGDFNKLQRMPERIDPADGYKSTVSANRRVHQLDLKQALEQLFLPGSTQAPETALFYFSGHGLPDTKGFDKGYLATHDTDPNNPIAGISLRWLQWLLSESQVKQQIIWLDCCHSGSLLVDLEAANPGNDENRNRCFIASSRDFEQSWEDVGTPYSVLTKALLEGLDPTRLPEGQIDTSALVAYVTKALKGGLQVPICTTFGEAIKLTGSLPIQPAGKVTNDPDAVCPYKGLSYFDDNDYDYQYFYGRRALTDELIDAVRTSNFVAIVGASGSGKSSVLRAGLLHQLKQGRIPGSDQWDIRLMLPGESPCQALAEVFVDTSADHLERTTQLTKAEELINKGVNGLRRLVQTTESQKIMLVIDQFEEVFTLCQKKSERQRFFETVLGALKTSENKLCVVLAMRADFVGQCFKQRYSGLSDLIREHLVPVKTMTQSELTQAIEAPAKEVQLGLEPELTQTLIEAVENAPGSLPLLQYTLKELWQRRQRDKLTFFTYQALGGINGTLDKRATEIYNSFDADEQRTVQHIFQHLTRLGEGTEDTRRRVFLDNLIAKPLHSPEKLRTVINTLSNRDNRLLVTSEVIGKGETQKRRAIVDVAHEALIRHWRLLGQWIEENRDLLRQQRKIELNATAWQEKGQESGYLLQGAPLVESIKFSKQQAENFPLSESAKAFIKQSIKQRYWHRIKSAGWFIPLLVGVGILDFNVRETRLKADLKRLDEVATYEERIVVENLVKGCLTQFNTEPSPNYFSERLLGNCRSLFRAPLEQSQLSNADLSYAYLRNANLQSAVLKSADLSKSNLRNANLNPIELNSNTLIFDNLSPTNLNHANLSESNLYDADLKYADLQYSNLRSANLKFADLSHANLHKADLSDVTLSEDHRRRIVLYPEYFYNTYFKSRTNRWKRLRPTNLSYVNLSYANLSYANLLLTNLSNANLSYANLSNANLNFVDLSNAYLSDADLTESILNYANLPKANLRAVNLSGAELAAANLNDIYLIDSNLTTIL